MMSIFDGVYCEEDEDANDSPYCECGSLHGMEEIDFNQCDHCGKIIELESPQDAGQDQKPNEKEKV
jgi:hypothetical protein